jgi:hypothetical protein
MGVDMVIATSSRILGTVSSVLRGAALLLLCLLVGCAPAASGAPQILDALRAEQQTNHIVIGYKSGEQLEYIDTSAGNAFRQVSMPGTAPEPQSIELRGTTGVRISSDGNWVASCADGPICRISRKADERKNFPVSRTKALTPLYFSSDAKFVFLVEKAPNWRFPLRCSFEDERDVIVYETATGMKSVLTTVCGGFPYGNLRWYDISAP